jgi:excisionase family DNA binding protein
MAPTLACHAGAVVQSPGSAGRSAVPTTGEGVMSVVRIDHKTRPRSLDEYPDVLTLREVAQILRRSEDRTRTWLRTSAIHAVRVGGSWRVAKSVLIAHLSGEEAPSP